MQKSAENRKEFQIEKNHISGNGWHLVLSDGWQAAPQGDGSYTIIKH